MSNTKTPALYGIKNCDTMKKAFAWLRAAGVEYHFHDYKQQGVDENIVRRAIAHHGWEKVINRSGTTWRQLPQDEKEAVNEETAVVLAMNNPSIIKRPLLAIGDEAYLGFDAGVYQTLLMRS